MRLRPIATRLDRYIARQLLLALIAVTGGLALLIWLTQSLRFVELVVNHGMSLGVFLRLTGLLIPSFVAVILPITTYVVVQFIYQRLAGDRELTVMRAAGLSSLALARPALAVATFAILAGYLLNLVIVPASLRDFREFQFEIRNRIAAYLLQEGVFTPVTDDVTVYVRSRAPDGSLRGILVDDARQKGARATILAERGQLVEGPAGPQVILFNGSRQDIDPKTGRLNILTFGRNVLDLGQAAHNNAERLRDMSEVSLSDLLHPPPSIAPNPRDLPKWHAEAHKRLATPLTAGSFGLIALAAVLTGQFRRHGGLMRTVVAIGIVTLLLALGLAADNLAARDNHLIALIWLQAVAPGLVAAIVLLRPDVRVRRPVSGRPLLGAQVG
jgi:lipopolysaccharide export system permease protein